MKRKASNEHLKPTEKIEIASTITIVDPEGDLQIDFKKDGAPVRPPVGLLVNRHILCLASPVFRAMLAEKSPFRQSSLRNGDGIPVVFFEDDDPPCMLIMMYTMHFQGHRVPQYLTLDLLHQIAILSDKYDLGRSLGTWGRLWAKPYVDYIEDGGYARLLFISIVFTIPDVFYQITRHIILEATIWDGALDLDAEVGFWEDGVRTKSFWKDGIPESVFDSLKSARAETVDQISAICYKRVCMLRLEKYEGGVCPHDRYEPENIDCDALNLGSIMHECPDLQHEPESIFDPRSVSQIKTDIDSIRSLSEMNILQIDFKRRHADSCDSVGFLQRKIRKVLDNVEGLQLSELASQPAPEAPDWVQSCSEYVLDKDDQCQLIMRYIAVSDATEMPIMIGSKERGPPQVDTRFKYVPMIKCLDCPGRLYMVTDIDNDLDFQDHLNSVLHKTRREKRVAESKSHLNPPSGEDG